MMVKKRGLQQADSVSKGSSKRAENDGTVLEGECRKAKINPRRPLALNMLPR